ncbi:hypothetical protein AALO_G00033360 [Alosa alosa]|uniref:SAM domain-containing protein n=1 Tax=Alosa alosa TaxID=278164 RepID=A0AAV6HG64_9TELE|nr:hypothetical protein AALO_G00033360 [Alosa alosa]
MLITKIEAKQACDWLRAAGFPQYAQLFKECRFPVDLDWAKNDHAFLDQDAMDSLCRFALSQEADYLKQMCGDESGDGPGEEME